MCYVSWSYRGELYLKSDNVGAIGSDVRLERYLNALGALWCDRGSFVIVAREFTQKHRAKIERSVFSHCS